MVQVLLIMGKHADNIMQDRAKRLRAQLSSPHMAGSTVWIFSHSLVGAFVTTTMMTDSGGTVQGLTIHHE
jgi:hypothetical protein